MFRVTNNCKSSNQIYVQQRNIVASKCELMAGFVLNFKVSIYSHYAFIKCIIYTQQTIP